MNKDAHHNRRRAKERRGFRVLMWIPIWFLLAQIGGGLILDYVWVRPRYPMKDEMLAFLRSRKTQPEIFFFGSSRFGGDINCEVMDAELRHRLGEEAPRTFNAALPAGDPTVSERTLNELLDAGYRPKLVVLEIEPGCVAGKDNWLYQHVLNVLDWRDVPEVGPALCRNGRIMYLIRGRLLPLYLHNYQIRKQGAELAKSLLSAGEPRVIADPPIKPAIGRDPEPPPLTPAVRAVMEHGGRDFANEVKGYHLNGVAAHRLERLLKRCHAARIPVLLVDVPVSSPQRRARTPEVEVLFADYIGDLTERYGCHYTDWRDQVPDRYFYDGHHTHREGGVFFSRRFAAREIAPWWRDGAYGR